MAFLDESFDNALLVLMISMLLVHMNNNRLYHKRSFLFENYLGKTYRDLFSYTHI